MCDHCHRHGLSLGLRCAGKHGRAAGMNAPAIPVIFSPARRAMRLERARRRQLRPDAARFLTEDMIEDTLERLAFLRHQPSRTVVLGDGSGELARHLNLAGAAVQSPQNLDLEQPYPDNGFGLIVVVGLLDAVNDLPGALIHLRNALAPGGLVIAHFIGGQSLPALRAAMLAAEPDRPSARIHPLVDPRAAPGLLQRAGWKDPVVDTHTLTVRYSALDRLVADLRDCGLGNALAKPAAPLGKAALARAHAAFASRAEPDGKTAESFEIITLTGRRSLAGT
jgi:SAM-dependent methyltransferase